MTGNWPYLIRKRDKLECNDDNPFTRFAWCHGATGIGLSRLGCLAIEDNSVFRDDIQAALQSTLAYMEVRKGSLDIMCCGQAGRIDFLLEAGRKMAQPDLIDTAQRYAQNMAKQKNFLENSPLSVDSSHGAAIYSPGFFQGDAGIGYEFLRLCKPDEIPCVLLFD